MRFMLVSLLLSTASASDCILGDFTLQTTGKCSTYATLRASFDAFFADKINLSPSCQKTAETELLALLGVASVPDADAALKTMCTTAFQSYNATGYNTTAFKDIAGFGNRYVDLYFRGATDWNEKVATLYPVDPQGTTQDPESNILRRDASRVLRFYEGNGQYGMVQWPTQLDYLDVSKCNANAAYCCWPKDRQANDNNGNCARPYDKNCVDADPADNTDLCYVEPNKGAGFFTFPGDDNNKPYTAEGPIHCHGFGWVDGDATDPSVVYRANNLFYISMYDHMFQRGYVRNIEGAPMCGCAEEMPVVSRADCTEMTVAEKFSWTYISNTNTFVATLTDIAIKFAACTGIDPTGAAKNNDLWAYANRQFISGRLPRSKLQLLSKKIVGNNNCAAAQKRLFSSKQLIRGYTSKVTEWILLVGRESLGAETAIGREASKYLMGVNTASPPSILRRLCATCATTHQVLYFKRLTPVPFELDLVDHLKSGRISVAGNQYGVDFLIFSSYKDTKDANNTKAWLCPMYKYTNGFPGDCAPDGKILGYQDVVFGSQWSSQTDGAWHVETSSRTLTPIATTLVGINKLLGAAFTVENKVYLSGSGTDIWASADGFNFLNQSVTDSSNITMVVRVSSFDFKDGWSKAALMLRESTAATSKHYSVIVTGQNGFYAGYRNITNGTSSGGGSTSRIFPPSGIWLKLTKRKNVFTGFSSINGQNWTQITDSRKLSLADTGLIAGLSVTSRSASRVSEAVFENYTLSQTINSK